MKEFALSKQESYNLIKKHSGNMKEALIYNFKSLSELLKTKFKN